VEFKDQEQLLELTPFKMAKGQIRMFDSIGSKVIWIVVDHNEVNKDNRAVVK